MHLSTSAALALLRGTGFLGAVVAEIAIAYVELPPITAQSVGSASSDMQSDPYFTTSRALNPQP
jgi:hypothetical protein